MNGIEYPAGVGVSLFLILSGYGIELSVKKNGLNKFWIKRFFRVLVPYILTEFIFFIVQGKDLSFTDVIMDFSLLKPCPLWMVLTLYSDLLYTILCCVENWKNR